MDNLQDWSTTFQEGLTSLLATLGASLPGIGAAIGIMFVGWLFARILRAIILRLGGGVNRVMGSFGRPMTSGSLSMANRLISLAAKVLYWCAVLIFAAVAARVAGLDAFSLWLDRVLIYLPTLVAGLIIAIVGYLLSTLVRDVVTTTLISVGSNESELAGIAAQTAVILTAFVIGLDQIGIDVTFLIILSSVLLGGALLALALAFGFGARDFVSNLIAAHQLRELLETGEHAVIAGAEGRILEVTPTSVVLLGDKGRFLVPAATFQKQITLIASSDIDE